MARFCPLFSGSSGNCLYIGTSTAGILIDAGVSARRIGQALTAHEIDLNTIRAIFVTHEHSDHISGLRVLQKHLHIPIYASFGTCQGIEEAGAYDSDYLAITDTVEMDEFSVTPFKTSHDSRESTGFRVTLRDGRRVGIATDLGIVTSTVREQLRGCDLIHIESNHDVRMLENGPYPYVLKRRILSSSGHLSNEACAAELPDLIRHGTTRIFLGHLSRENNLPTLAEATAQSTLESSGMTRNIDYVLQVASPANDKPYTLF